MIFTTRKSKDTHMLFVIELLLLSPETNSIALTLYVAYKQFIPMVGIYNNNTCHAITNVMSPQEGYNYIVTKIIIV